MSYGGPATPWPNDDDDTDGEESQECLDCDGHGTIAIDGEREECPRCAGSGQV